MNDSSAKPLFAGRYREIKELGSGAFGSVWQVEQEAFGITFRQAALKKFETALKGGMQTRRVFTDAISLMRLLDACEDPLIKSRFIQIYDVGAVMVEKPGKAPSEQGYITMELMDTSLRDVVGPTGSSRFKKCTAKEALAYMAPIIEALAFMHRQRPPMLHRDLKPENILLKKGKEQTQLKVADFGLAIQHFHTVDRPQAAGTWTYQDLESFTHDTSATESDVFALGMMFYELLTGHYPYKINFSGLSADDETCRAVLKDNVTHAMNQPVKPPSDYNFELKPKTEYHWLEEMVMGCLTRHRIDRIVDAVELERFIRNRQVGFIQRTPEEKYKYHLNKGKAAQHEGKTHWPEAEAEYREAIKALSRPCDAHVQLADLLLEQKKLDEAEKILMDRINKDLKECSHVYLKLAELYQARNNKTMPGFYSDKAQALPKCPHSIFHAKPR